MPIVPQLIVTSVEIVPDHSNNYPQGIEADNRLHFPDEPIEGRVSGLSTYVCCQMLQRIGCRKRTCYTTIHKFYQICSILVPIPALYSLIFRRQTGHQNFLCINYSQVLWCCHKQRYGKSNHAGLGFYTPDISQRDSCYHILTRFPSGRLRTK